jgi:hypothetical protein
VLAKDPASASEERSLERKWWTLIAVSVAIFMLPLEAVEVAAS